MNTSPKDGSFRRRDPRQLMLVLALLAGCGQPAVPYGVESKVSVSSSRGTTWAVAPMVNLSGQQTIDPLLHADMVFQQLQQIEGITAIPVDRVVGVFVATGIEQVQTPEQAAIVCELLGADALLVPAVTAWDPYNPPKMGATLTLFSKPGAFVMDTSVDPAELVRRASLPSQAGPSGGGAIANEGVVQAVGMFDAADGSVREAVLRHANGRSDPLGPWGPREYFVNSEKYATFVYRQLTRKLLEQVYQRVPTAAELAAAKQGGEDPSAAAKAGENDRYPPGGPAGPQPFPSNRR
jgi:hypothetical protein